MAFTKNLGEALKRFLDKHNLELRQAAKEIAEAGRTKENKQVNTEKPKQPESKTITFSNNADQPLTKYELIFLEAKRLRAAGHSIKSIRRQTGMHRQTIK